MREKSKRYPLREMTKEKIDELSRYKSCNLHLFFMRWMKIIVFLSFSVLTFSAISPFITTSFSQEPVVMGQGDESVLDEISFQFSAGWNYLTIPVENNLTAQSLMDLMGCCTIMLDWDGIAQSFVVHVYNTPGNDFPIRNGHSYIFYVTENCTFTIMGLPIETVSVPVFHQWGVLGWPFNYSTTAESVGRSIPGCTLVIIFDPHIQYYKAHVVGNQWNNFPIEQGSCFEVYVTTSSIWIQER